MFSKFNSESAGESTNFSKEARSLKNLLDFFRNSIGLLKLPFLTSLSQNFSTLCLHRLSKFVDKSAQKSSIFSIKASFERSLFPFSFPYLIFFSLFSFFLVAFGQPAWLPWNGVATSVFGFALFFLVLLHFPSYKKRFLVACCWFFFVQLIQLSWMISHPFLYIYAVYIFFSLALALQFGLLSWLIDYKIFKNLNLYEGIGRCFLMGAVWSLMEWSRLFFLSGFSWNPVGLSLACNIYSLQVASLVGVFGLSFFVIFVNTLAVYAWVDKGHKKLLIFLWIGLATFPYIFGFLHIYIQDKPAKQTLKAMLVQTAFVPEELRGISDGKGMLANVLKDWHQILVILKKYAHENCDLIVLPEFVVPFGTHSAVYPLKQVVETFSSVFGEASINLLPKLRYPFYQVQTFPKEEFFVTNAYFIQGIANILQSDLLVGLEDAEEVSPGNIEYYSTAQFVHPEKELIPHLEILQQEPNLFPIFSTRYIKQILVPLGEYIPFAFCKTLASSYGVFGSFTCGGESIVMKCKGIEFAPSICYEETFGYLINKGRTKGLKLLVNLTSDVWFPNSKLPLQHLELSRLRTVENGVPLIRACNNGITVAIDSLGRTLAQLGGNHPELVEWIPDALVVDVPLNTYSTLYGRFGDKIILSFSILIIILYALYRTEFKK